jgi:nucleoside-diphosphate-sugar epimerase
MRKILLTGGAGYVGSVLVPKLLQHEHEVHVIDLFIYGDHVLDEVKDHPRLKLFKGDIRDQQLLSKSLEGCDTVIHLACISNDPSFELNPALGKSINFDAFFPLLEYSRKAGVKQFIFASSSSVYGVKKENEVTEDLLLEPLTDYSRFKAECERALLDQASPEFRVTIVRPATVCGYSPRLRLDLTVNILTNHAVNKGEITVFGGDQLRPNLHIEDMTDLYCFLLEIPPQKLHKKIYNVGYQNFSVREIAEMVRRVVAPETKIKVSSSDDNRSYKVCSRKIQKELGFVAKHSVEDAIKDLKSAFHSGKIPDPLTDNRYFNIKTMQAISLK